MTRNFRSNIDARAQCFLLVSALSLWSLPAVAQNTPERLSDKDVKALIDQVDEGRDKFEGNLDGKFKGSTLRRPTGETKVEGALQDYQDSTKKLKDRFTPKYSASAEVAAVLKQSTLIDTFMQGEPTAMKGRSEWDRQTVNLKKLAAAYGTAFPLAEGATVRRMNDDETAEIASELASAADEVKHDVDKAMPAPSPEREAAKKELDVLIKHAKAVKSRVGDGKPATAELQLLVEQATRLRTHFTTSPLPTMSNWEAVQASLAKLQQAFNLTP